MNRRFSVVFVVALLLVTTLLLTFNSLVTTDDVSARQDKHLATATHSIRNLSKRSDYSPPSEDSDDNNMDVTPSPQPQSEPSEGQEVITNEVLQRFIRKGTNLMRWISQSANEATQDMQQHGMQVTSSQSPFTHYHSLRANGWVVTVDHDLQRTSWAEDIPIEQTLEALGMDTTLQVLLPVNPQPRTAPGGGSYGVDVAHVGHAANSFLKREHYLESTVGNSNYQPTFAAHSSVYSPKNGAIIGFRSDSPTATINAGNAQGANRPPPLNRRSDVAFMEYQQLCEQQGYPIEDLRYIFGFRATNILESQNPPRDPHHTTWQQRLALHPSSNEFKAILGSPIGSIYAFMLINHKQAWGDKRIRSISIFFDQATLQNADQEHQHPTLLFELESLGGNKQGSKSYVGKSGGVQKQQPKKGSGGSTGSRQSERLKGQQTGQ